MKIVPVVMSGGVGSRLWPLSRELYPKQLLPLVNADATLLQDTLKRAQSVSAEPAWIICNQEHRFLVADQSQSFAVTPDRIILEPVGRNTAPAIAVAALEQLKTQEDALLLVLAADHAISDTQAFSNAIQQGVAAAKAGRLVTFGITPTAPETGYGYIKQGADLGDGSAVVSAFVEKPDLKTAQDYLASGEYLWNSGMFLFGAKAYLAELEKHAPEIYGAAVKSVENAERVYGYVQLNEAEFVSCPDDSVDYAVMEHTQLAAVVPMSAGWNDVGSWTALWDLGEKDDRGNQIHGNVIVEGDARNNLIRADKRLVSVLGVSDLLIVDTKDALLVADKSRAQDVKKIVSRLKAEGREEAQIHARAFRPWGSYETVDEEGRFKVKRIVVNPGAQLSLQMHHHRAEHWIVVKGTAKVTRGDTEFLLSENESTYIPLGEKHRLENPGKMPLEIVEVQSGSYLGEDDIVRYSDQYGRSDVDGQSK